MRSYINNYCCFHIRHQLNEHISVILVPTSSFVMLVSILIILTKFVTYCFQNYSGIIAQTPCANKAFSSTSIRFNPNFDWYVILIHSYTNTSSNVRNKCCRCAREYFICTCICSWLYVFELTVTGWYIIVT